MAALFGEFWRRQEAERPDAVGHRDEHHAALGEVGAVIELVGGGAGVEAAAIDPHDHRQLVRGRLGRGPDVEIEAVLAIGDALAGAAAAPALHAAVPEVGGLLHPAPRRRRLRRLPAQIAHRRRGERDALEFAEAVGGHAGDLAAGHARLGDLSQRWAGDGQGEGRERGRPCMLHVVLPRGVNAGSALSWAIAQPLSVFT